MDERTKQYAAYYDAIADRYTSNLNLRMLLAGGEKGFRRKLYRHIKDHIRGDVLEVCCGPGNLTRVIADGYDQGTVTGVDVSPRFIELAKQTIRQPHVTFAVGDVTHLSFESGSFDTVVLCMALHEMQSENIRAALAEMRRVVKPRGALILIEHHLPRNPVVKWFYDLVVVDEHEKDTTYAMHRYGLRRYVQESGLSLVNNIVINSGIIEIIVASPAARGGAVSPAAPAPSC
jgi:ubiquinone/menaquinone biosynthesis C-methylase UbiE